MIHCRICNKEIAESASTCPGCGVKRPDMNKYKTHNKIWGVLWVVMGLGAASKQIWNHEIDGWLLLPGFLIVMGIYCLYYGITGKDFEGNKASQ